MLTVSNLKTEYLKNPICVPLQNIRFGWAVECDERAQEQAAYQILVQCQDQTVWDSGKVFCEDTCGISYGGAPLQARTKYSWQVRVWTKQGECSAFSAPQTFETCLSPQEWESASFIGACVDGLPLLRKAFQLPNKQIVRARVYVCGLGFYELSLNGKRVSDEFFNPAVTRYHHRYFYNAYDITPLLNGGENVFGVMLTGGHYAMAGNGTDWQTENWANAVWADSPKCRLVAFITYADGTEIGISTDESWKSHTSPLCFENAYYGEEYDARKCSKGWDDVGFDDSGWESVQRVPAPLGKAEPQLIKPCKVAQKLPLKLLYQKENESLYDTQKMAAGWVRLTVVGNCGDEVEISYSEWLNDEGELDQKFLLPEWNFAGKNRQPQTDCFVLSGGEETLAPRFTYKGFRYARIRVKGNVEIKTAVAESVYANLQETGEFACSDKQINQLHDACKNALLNNLHGYPSDTPIYEKMGYLADGYVTQEMAHYNFDAVNYYEKWARDILDQAKADGYLEQTAPMWDEDKENAPEWSVAIAVVPYQIYKATGDKTLLLESYEKSKRVFDYQMRLTQGSIAMSMWGDHACAGERTIKEISATAALYFMANILAQTAKLKEGQDEYERYSAYARQIKAAFNARFYDGEKGYYCEYDGAEFAVNAQILSCGMGLADEEQTQKIAAYIKDNSPKLYCGIFAVKYAFPVLTEMGLEERLYAWLKQTTPPSWGYWLSFGDGSLWEQWGDFTRSRNHHMFGSVDEWLYKGLAGLETTDSKTLKIKPFFAQGLQWASARAAMPSGEAACRWEKGEKGIKINLKIPFNVKATVYLPKGFTESLESVRDVNVLHSTDKEIVFLLGSGNYEFEIK